MGKYDVLLWLSGIYSGDKTMSIKNWHYWIIVAIAGITLLSGIVQLFVPELILRILQVENTSASQHFFATIGMFMAIIGGALLHTFYNHTASRVLIFWTSLQKFGASILVAMGVMKGIFSPLALLVAGFDFFSAILFLWYWVCLRQAVVEEKENAYEQASAQAIPGSR